MSWLRGLEIAWIGSRACVAFSYNSAIREDGGVRGALVCMRRDLASRARKKAYSVPYQQCDQSMF